MKSWNEKVGKYVFKNKHNKSKLINRNYIDLVTPENETFLHYFEF